MVFDVILLVFKQIWDAVMSARWHRITSGYYRGVDGIITVYDITEKSSFDNLPIFLNEIDKFASENVSQLLIGNKIDLESEREVCHQEVSCSSSTSINSNTQFFWFL